MNTVDFPAPFGPISAKISRSVTWRLSPLSASRPPKLIERSSTLSTGYSDLSQSVSGVKRPFSTRTHNPRFCVSWSAPIVSGGRMPLS